MYYTYLESPVGPLLLVSDGRALAGIYMGEHRHGPEVDLAWTRKDDAPPFPQAKEQLTAYFQGRRREFDLPLAAAGTPFQQRVWEELRRIPYGATMSYAELAQRVGNPSACRAVGQANGRNPLSIVVPCHRVVGASGKLVGYGGGLTRKERLLALEAGTRAERAG